MKNILFYKYIELNDLDSLKKKYYKLCKSLSLQGTILLASEGINGCLTGDEKEIEFFKEAITNDPLFSDLEFKEGVTNKHGFEKLKVKIRDEIVTSRLDVDVHNAGTYLEPHELKKWFDSHEDFIMVDMRNTYESDIGKFDNTIALHIDTFRQLPDAMDQLEGLENKKIVTYCTGGVRCEKGSAFLKQQGFKNVYQLHGGILKYGATVGNAHWNGKCLVFDKRGAVDIDPDEQSEPISQCVLCNLPCSDYHNCEVVNCDKRFLACDKCHDTLHGCCSKGCRGVLKN